MLASKLLEAAGNSTQPIYIEDVFSTYLYTGNGSTQTITNGIDLAGKGGMVWLKSRSTNYNNLVTDTAQGIGSFTSLVTSEVGVSYTTALSAFNSNGFTTSTINGATANGQTFASWTFRKQPKFFDVVTYTGNGTAGRAISHNLGSVPGCFFVKNITTGGFSWITWHRAINGGDGFAFLNATNAAVSPDSGTFWGNGSTYTAPTSTTFTVSNVQAVNGSGDQYVAYIFAHNAGGFGLTGTDNVISCGSFTLDGSGQANVDLGYQPQWIMYKRTDGAGNWVMVDTMRGWTVDTASVGLVANGSFAEPVGTPSTYMRTTGFNVSGSAGQSFIYIAIRRGPMKVPTDGTKVFAPVVQAGAGTVTTNFPVDLLWTTPNNSAGNSRFSVDRLRGASKTSTAVLTIESTAAEWQSSGYGFGLDSNVNVVDNGFWANLYTVAYWNFRRAPGFFDEVCYTGDGVAGRTITTNLNAVGAGSTMCAIVKRRNSTGGWVVTMAGYQMLLNTTDPESATTTDNGYVYNLAANSFKVGAGTTIDYVNASGSTYVAYLFATCPGVSKVGSYTGNGSTQTINCGFTGGARFVLIKRTDAAGDWYVYDTARGITSGNDPYLLMNSTAAEMTLTDYISPQSSGFGLTAAGLATVNVSGASYIYLAIA